jgi:hypothetical protein
LARYHAGFPHDFWEKTCQYLGIGFYVETKKEFSLWSSRLWANLSSLRPKTSGLGAKKTAKERVGSELYP